MFSVRRIKLLTPDTGNLFFTFPDFSWPAEVHFLQRDQGGNSSEIHSAPQSRGL